MKQKKYVGEKLEIERNKREREKERGSTHSTNTPFVVSFILLLKWRMKKQVKYNIMY